MTARNSRELRELRRKSVAMARETIQFTRTQLIEQPDLVAMLDRVLAGEPVPELADESRSDPAVLKVSLELAEIDAILAALLALEKDRPRPQPGEGALSLAPSLADAWGMLQQAARLAHRQT